MQWKDLRRLCHNTESIAAKTGVQLLATFRHRIDLSSCARSDVGIFAAFLNDPGLGAVARHARRKAIPLTGPSERPGMSYVF
jgi:hypothetical protein